MKKIFISSTREDLKEEREKLISFIDKMPDCKAIAMEKFSASKDRSKELCLAELRDSTVLILIFGFKYGSIDEEEDISFTEIEYNAAKEIGKLNMPIFVFLKQKNGEWDSEEQDTNIGQKLIAFKSRIDNDQVWASFETLDELIEEVSLTLYKERIKREKLEFRLNLLISPKEFFKPFLNKDKYFNHNYSFIGRENFINDLNNFIFSDKKIALIQGRGGIGKSKILFEFSQNFIDNNKEWELKFLNEHVTISKDTFPQLSPKIIMVIDDAHRRNEEEIALLLNILEDHSNYKVIISCRPYGLNYIKTTLNRAGIDPKEVNDLPEINELTSENLEKLGLEILGKEYQHLIKPLIHVAKDSPLVMVVGGNLIKEKKINPMLLERQIEFQDIVFNRFKEELIGEISDINNSLYGEILSLISALSPIDTNNKEFYIHASKFLEIKSYELIRIIDSLETSGIFIRRGNSIKITPDVLSDHILHNACVTTKGQSTGYTQEIFNAFWDFIPQNLLLNLSELDWRIRQEKESDSLLSEIWGEIEKEFKEASNSRRVQILGYLERIAIFHPRRTLKIVEFAIQNPSEKPEDEDIPSILQNTHRGVLQRLPNLLHTISHHLNYLPRCCELLWELGKDDQRNTNPYPGHAMRVFSDIAKYDIDKSVTYNFTVLDVVEKLLKDPTVHEHYYSLLDVLDQLLAKEGTLEETTGFQLNFTPFSVSYENTKHVRERALTLLSECGKLDSTKTKLRVFKSFYTILWPPYGEHGREVNESEVDKWIPEQIEVLNIIENLIRNTNDPIVFIQAYSDLKRVSKVLKDEESEKANYIANFIPNSLDLQVTRALWNKYDKFYDYENLKYSKMLEKIENIKKQIALELLKKCDNSQKLFNYLEKKMDDLEKSKVQYNPDEFFILLGLENYKIAVELCRSIISNQECILSPYLSALMSGVRQEDKEEFIKLSKLALKTGNKKIIYSLAQGYGGRRSWTSSLDDDDIKLIKKLLNCPDEDIKRFAILSLGGFQDMWKPLAIELALKTDIKDNNELADAFCDIFDENSIKIEELRYPDIKHILNKLISIKEIDHRLYNIQRFIGYCSSKYPHLVVDFLLDRILLLKEKEKELTWHDRYEPLPHEFHSELKITEHPDYINILRKVRDKILDPNFSNYWISKLFIKISDNLSPVSLQVLREWVNSNNIEKVKSVVLLIEHANPDFVFSHVEFVSQLLSNSYSLNVDSYEKIMKRLINHTNFRTRSSLSRQSSLEDVEIREKSQEIAEKLPINSPAQKFYLLLHENAKEKNTTPVLNDNLNN